MPPKRHGPTPENTAKRPREKGPIQYKCRHIQAIGTSRQSIRKKLYVRVAGYVVGRVASANVGRMASAVIGGW